MALAVASGTVALPSANAGTYVQTQSGKMRCTVTANGEGTGNDSPTVICEASGRPPSLGGDNIGFLQAPMTDYGTHYHAAIVDSAGNFHFGDGGNIGGAGTGQDLVMTYGQTYRLHGWTIESSTDGTRFTNDRTGHGMFVSIQDTYGF
ncbi:hypothetical protein [Mycobacterium sp. IS-1742]|uniref:hypothetical protein n=1 Tax=Mycobacterium sp. IS-1742 TaxID=1772285 RepID=UPI0012FAE86E|nr:hypothetical protein [Mycobacterium sp. IS-1742]